MSSIYIIICFVFLVILVYNKNKMILWLGVLILSKINVLFLREEVLENLIWDLIMIYLNDEVWE